MLLQGLLGHHLLLGKGLLLEPEQLLGGRIEAGLRPLARLGPPGLLVNGSQLRHSLRHLLGLLRHSLRLLGHPLGLLDHPRRDLRHLRQREGHVHLCPRLPLALGLALREPLREGLHRRHPLRLALRQTHHLGLTAPGLLLLLGRLGWLGHVGRHGRHHRRRSGESHTARRHEGRGGDESTSHVVTTSFNRFGWLPPSYGLPDESVPGTRAHPLHMLDGRGCQSDVEAVKSRLARGYSRTAAHYDELAGPIYLAGIQRLLPFVRVPPTPAILDVGCGTGLNLVEAARRFGPARLLAGIDISPGMVAVARAKTAALGLPAQIIQGDAERLPYPDGLFDLVLCNSVFHWFRDRPAAMREMARVLRPGGQLALITATAPGFSEWFTLIDALARSACGPGYASSVPDLPTGAEVGALMNRAGLLVQAIRNPVHRTRVHHPAAFVQLMSVIAPHWAADLPDETVALVQQTAAALMHQGWPAGFPVTWSAVEALGVKP